MLSSLRTVALLATFAAAATAERITSVVEGRLNTGTALHEVRLVLNDGQYVAVPRQDGTFVFHAVMPGSYLLEVHDVHNLWPTVRLDVSAKKAGKVQAMLSHNKQLLPFPMPLEPLVVKPTHFEVRPPFQWTGMLMNPMFIMMGVTLLLMVAMPKMMANMDPEQLKEMQEMQASMGGGGGLADLLNPEKLKEKQKALEDQRKAGSGGGGGKKKSRD